MSRPARARATRHWNHRVREAIARIDALFFFDHLYIGGGNARRVDRDELGETLERITIIDNSAGILGGIKLWEDVLSPTRTESPLSWDPISEQYKEDPHAVWRLLRDEAPVYYNPTHDFYALSRFVDVDAAHRDPGRSAPRMAPCSRSWVPTSSAA